LKKITFIIFLILVFSLFTNTNAQKKQPSAFASVKVYPTSVILNQPFKFTVSVFTETWFTKAPDVFDLQIPYSFTVSLGRPFSTYETIKGKRYTTLNYEYLIFPARIGEMEVPEITISFESPPEGDYKGVAIGVKTPKRIINIAGIPDDFTGEKWFVANSISVSQSWNRKLEDLKVGNFIERTVTIRTSGTVAALIPELKIEKPEWASIYSKTPKLENSINDNVISSSRSEKITYLLEKDGEYTIPEIVIDYYNPYQKKLHQRSLKAIQLFIQDNPDLAVLKSLQDSLNALREQPAETDTKGFELFGMNLWQLLIRAALIVFLVLLLIKTIVKIRKQLNKKKEEYLNTELYLFKQFHKESSGNNYQKIYSAVVKWMDKVYQPHTTKGLINFAEQFEEENEDLVNLDEYLYGNPELRPDSKSWSGNKLYKYFSKIRKNIIFTKRKLKTLKDDLPELNP